MRKSLGALAAVAVLLAAGAYLLVPWASPSESCRTLWRSPQAEALLNRPMDIAWSDGDLYVADTENGAIRKLREDGALVATWTGFARPVDVAVVDDAIYVADFVADRISRLNAHGELIQRWGGRGTGPGEFDAPSGVAVDPAGDVYVTDFYNHRVQKFTADGQFLLQWGRPGRWHGQLHYPTDLAVNGRGEVFVADAYNHRVQAFTDAGDHLSGWGGVGYGIPGRWRGWFRLAKALDVDTDGDVYVADAFNRRVQKFTHAGRFVAAWASGTVDEEEEGLRYPAGVAAASDGRVFVTDFFGNRIWAFRCARV